MASGFPKKSPVFNNGSRNSDDSDGDAAPPKLNQQLALGGIQPSHVIDSIPSELLSLILEFGYFDLNRSNGETEGPNVEFRTTLLQTSHRFRDVTIHTPSVWSVIRLSSQNVDREIQHLPVYLERSMDYPLDIQIGFIFDDAISVIMAHLVPHSRRWHRISLTLVDDNTLPFLRNIPLPILDVLDINCHFQRHPKSISSFTFDVHPPRLSHLSLRHIVLEDMKISFQGLKVLEICGGVVWSHLSQFKMLASANVLERLMLYVPPGELGQTLDSFENRESQIILPALRAFFLHTSQSLSAMTIFLIRLFTCPRLQSLIVYEGSKTIINYSEDAYLPERPLSFYHPSQKVVSTVPRDYLGDVIPGSHLPALHSLVFKNISSYQLSTITAHFILDPYQYPSLTSLHIVDLLDGDPNNLPYIDLVNGFPRLRRLSLDGVSSNAFVQQLIPKTSVGISDDSSDLDSFTIPWPDFEVLSICNDTNASKPLLHRVITARKRIGRPILKLVLDHHFSSNVDSWNWIKEHVEVVEARK